MQGVGGMLGGEGMLWVPWLCERTCLMFRY